MAKQENPLGNLFPQLREILSYVVAKNKKEADRYETSEMARDAARYHQAILKQDNWLSYTDLYTEQLYRTLNPVITRDIIDYFLASPYNIPNVYRDRLTEYGRNIVLTTYEERNEYYRMLAGLPPLSLSDPDYIRIPVSIRSSLYATSVIPDLPIHELSRANQDLLMTTEWYATMVTANTDKPYLLYLGGKSIDPMIARNARDFQLIRYLPPENNSTINPYLLRDFTVVYAGYRDYVMLTIYNSEMENLFVNYRTFMGLLLTSYVLVQLCSRAVEHSTDYRFIDDKTMPILFQMYGIPSSVTVLMTDEVQRNLVTSLLKLIRKKATNPVFYDLISILGYDDVTISKLMLVREQKFDNGVPMMHSGGTSELIDSWEDLDLLEQPESATGEKWYPVLDNTIPMDDWEYDEDSPTELLGLPEFQAVDLKDRDFYQSLVSKDAPVFDYHTITDPDTRWWDDADTREVIRNKSYSVADSKYIMAESTISDSAYLYEVIYFTRMILDNKHRTDQFMVPVPELFGSTQVSMYDLMIFLVASSCYNYGLDGTLVTSASGLLAIAGFNFQLDLTDFSAFLERTEYADRDRIMTFLSNSPVTTPASINFIYKEVLLPFRDWLTLRMSESQNREEFLEYENVFRSTFSYDIGQQVFVSDFTDPLTRIKTRYGLTDNDLLQFQAWYPNVSGKAVTVDNYGTTAYSPFLGSTMALAKTWYVDTGRGNLYFYDILNSPDIRYVTDEDGETIPNPVLWDPDTDTFDTVATEQAVNAILALPGNQLGNAFFKVDTIIPGQAMYYPGVRYGEDGEVTTITYLPDSIRADGIFRSILIDKLEADLRGEAVRPATYLEYLERKNPMLADLFSKATISETDWMNTIMIIVMALEKAVSLHLKVFEQSILGTETYFKPLVTMIRYFKSYFIEFTRTSIKYVFDNKTDAGGGSNLLKLFDDIWQVMWHIQIRDELGLVDTETRTRHHWKVEDRPQTIDNDPYDTTVTVNGTSIGTFERQSRPGDATGSVRLDDAAKFFLNGIPSKEVDDDAIWLPGEPSTGRVSIIKNEYPRTDQLWNSVRESSYLVDTEAWKDYVESSSPR